MHVPVFVNFWVSDRTGANPEPEEYSPLTGRNPERVQAYMGGGTEEEEREPIEAVLLSVATFHFCKSSFFRMKRIPFHSKSSRITREAVNEKGILGPARPPTSRKARRS